MQMIIFNQMVKYDAHLDSIFHSLSDPIRRDILHLVAASEYSISELVSHYNISFVATAKHIRVLEKADLIIKRKEGKKYMIALAPDALKLADEYVEQYRKMWQSRHDKLEALLKAKELT